jgi:hypothetical protein
MKPFVSQANKPDGYTDRENAQTALSLHQVSALYKDFHLVVSYCLFRRKTRRMVTYKRKHNQKRKIIGLNSQFNNTTHSPDELPQKEEIQPADQRFLLNQNGFLR